MSNKVISPCYESCYSFRNSTYVNTPLLSAQVHGRDYITPSLVCTVHLFIAIGPSDSLLFSSFCHAYDTSSVSPVDFYT